MAGNDTLVQYDLVMETCKDIFLKKTQDYGTSWRVLRPISIADQIFIKAHRIRHIQQLGTQQVEDPMDSELRGIVNYGIIALVQEELGDTEPLELDGEEASRSYDRMAQGVKRLMQAKNHDYGEAWRDMSPESFVDLILMKLLRIRQILRNGGKTLASEGTAANFSDIINYAVFALIMISDSEAGK